MLLLEVPPPHHPPTPHISIRKRVHSGVALQQNRAERHYVKSRSPTCVRVYRILLPICHAYVYNNN